jgi:sigma-54 specific flagellar transcriptional regulator A
VSTDPLIGQSSALLELRRLIASLSNSASTVLISGESGTGKELVAKSLHTSGQRKIGHFVPVNCGAIPRDLIESELFGHRKGAFTGALTDRIGRFELAHGGTLFLDEIADLPLDTQVKLLRILQEKALVPLGSNTPVGIDVRVIAASHKNLEDEVCAGRFREDLYYRLNVIPITVCPLRERLEDIPLLSEYFIAKNRSADSGRIHLAPCMNLAFERYSWPGNIRELSNLIDRFSALYPGQKIRLKDIPDGFLPSKMARLKMEIESDSPASAPADNRNESDGTYRPPPPGNGNLLAEETTSTYNRVENILRLAQGDAQVDREIIPLKQRLIEVECHLITRTLERTQWNVSQTARLLSLQRTTLIEKMNKLGLRKSAG